MASKTKKKAKPKGKAKAKGKSRPKAKPKAKATPKKKRALKPKALRHNELVTIKVTPDELQMIFQRADKLAGGNVSRLLRHAARVCKTKAPEPAKKAA